MKNTCVWRACARACVRACLGGVGVGVGVCVCPSVRPFVRACVHMYARVTDLPNYIGVDLWYVNA